MLLVDSFRYIPPSRDQEVCDIYDESTNTSTTESVSSSTESSTHLTTESESVSTTPAPSEGECFTHNFESNVNDFLTNNQNVCNGNELWFSGSYSSLPLESPNPNSYTFISPAVYYSCVTSFSFPVTAGGTIEINIYTDLRASSDRLTILVHQERNHQTVGNYVIAGSNTQSGGRWLTAHVNVYGYGTFEGYVSIIFFILLRHLNYTTTTQRFGAR